MSESLDPRRASSRALLRAWLDFQREFAWRPQRALEVLDGVGSAAELPGRWPGRAPVAEARRLAEIGGFGVPFPSARYPARLRQLADPPPLLWLRGTADAFDGPCVAFVGPRAPSEYGRHVARSVAAALARLGVVIVSGLARGIDAEAHEAALGAGGRTIAFQACGPDRVYPSAHARLAERIAAAGAVVSELPLGAPPLKPHFPLRNRLISGISRALVVVEARARSGSLVTARHAADQGVPVLAVPGPIVAPTSEGTNRLIQDGAMPLLSVDDVLDAAGLEAARPHTRRAKAAAPDARVDGLAGRVRTALLERARDRDELAAHLGCEARVLAPVLLELEVAGRIAVEPLDGRLRWLGAVPGASAGSRRRGLSSASGSRRPGGDS